MTVYDFDVTTIDGEPQSLAAYRGQLLLIVNVASKCGFTPQYAGLEELYRRHKDQGLAVLGFPCDQFGHQEPGNEEEIKNFCSLTYEVTFPLFAKISVNGAETHPLYQYLKAAQTGLFGSESIKWNFTKFLVNREGQVVKRYATTDTPADIEKDIVRLLAAKPAAKESAHDQ
jgi:glutathione peroxidase